MKGIIFNLLEKVVSDKFGDDTWDNLLDAADVDGAYTAVGNYPDEELMRLVAAASKATGQAESDLIRWFGRTSLPMLAAKYPHFFAPHRSTRAFLLTLNDVIHSEVRKLYPGADVPVFRFQEAGPSSLRIVYRSRRKLCALAEGFIEGAAGHFGESVTHTQATCMLRGDPQCTFELGFQPQANPGQRR